MLYIANGSKAVTAYEKCCTVGFSTDSALERRRNTKDSLNIRQTTQKVLSFRVVFAFDGTYLFSPLDRAFYIIFAF
ncbi:hypothetical protein SDC9_58549 [bioreactor metagenome]|uniref:Uncharacterized protein n=1 Tax=bioreactor metagenome TaxID=1076179 RepID=A0A644X8E4_9ZZZZ